VRADHHGERGFTLLELIVAASILALVAVFSWRGLDQLIREREALAAAQATIDALQRSFARIERDALLAHDAELDGEGRLRLVGGYPSVDGSPPTTVEYRIENGTLVRWVAGVDRAPLVVFDGVASLALEAWSPGPRGGSWVRTKGMAMEPARPASGQLGGTGGATNAAGQPASANMAQQPAPPGTAIQPGNGNLPGMTGVAPVAAVPAATGVRFVIGFASGSQIIREFIVGGG